MKAQKIWFENGRIFLTTDDGRTGSLLLRAFPRLARASDEQRMKYELSRSGIHWPELDEDLSFEGFFDQPAETSDNRVAMAFAQFPEINVRQMARRMGINETLLAKYICGYSKPSEKRAKDEDLSFEGFFDQPAETSDNRVAMAFAQFPEINVRQMARRMGINETLLAKYICGYSKPSEKRAKEIEAALHDLGHKLTQISI